MATSSPWGIVQHARALVRGVTEVSTAGHGGLRVAPGWARKNLSEAAIDCAMPWGAYLWFEEDCLASLVHLESEAVRGAVTAGHPTMTPDGLKEYALKSALAYNVDYCLKAGVEVPAGVLARHQREREDAEARKRNSGDIVISATRADGLPGLVLALGADGRAHLATLAAYEAARAKSAVYVRLAEIASVITLGPVATTPAPAEGWVRVTCGYLGWRGRDVAQADLDGLLATSASAAAKAA